MVNLEIFRAYDIRGIYPTEINEEMAYLTGQAYASVLKPTDVVVGMDSRSSSSLVKDSLIDGLLDAGVNTIDIGQVTTDMIYFAVGAYGYSGGIAVTASHNPPQYNGMKMVTEEAMPVTSETGLFDIRDAIGDIQVGKSQHQTRGTHKKKDIIAEYIDHVLSFVDRLPSRGTSFVANANHGPVNRSVRTVADRLGLDIMPLNFETDGSFPQGPPDPTLPGNRVETVELVRKTGATFGVIWDGDGDRVVFIDENGRFIFGAYITALLAKIMLERFGGGNKIIFDGRVVWPILKVVKELEGIPIITRAGHGFIKDIMRSENGLFAGEMSGHYYFRDNFYADNGLIPLLVLIDNMSKEGKKLSEIVGPILEDHYTSDELSFRVDSIEATMKEVMPLFSEVTNEDFIDGYSAETEDWRFNLRPSQTEPLLRLNVEARQERLVGEIQEKIVRVIERHSVQSTRDH